MMLQVLTQQLELNMTAWVKFRWFERIEATFTSNCDNDKDLKILPKSCGKLLFD